MTLYRPSRDVINGSSEREMILRSIDRSKGAKKTENVKFFCSENHYILIVHSQESQSNSIVIKNVTWSTIKPIQTISLAVNWPWLHKGEVSTNSFFPKFSFFSFPVEIVSKLWFPKYIFYQNVKICRGGYLHFLHWRLFSLVLRNLFVFFILAGNRFMFYRRPTPSENTNL